MKNTAAAGTTRRSTVLFLIASYGLAFPLGMLWMHGVEAADPTKGRAIYMANCQNCHGVNGTGQLPGMPNFARGEGLLRPDMDIVRTIKSGKGMMPSYQGMFTDNEMLDLVAFLRTLR